MFKNYKKPKKESHDIKSSVAGNDEGKCRET